MPGKHRAQLLDTAAGEQAADVQSVCGLVIENHCAHCGHLGEPWPLWQVVDEVRRPIRGDRTVVGLAQQQMYSWHPLHASDRAGRHAISSTLIFHGPLL